MTYTKAEENLIVLSSFEELTYKSKRDLLRELKRCGDDPENFGKNLIKGGVSGVYNKVKDKFFDEGFRAKFLEGLEKRGVRCVTLLSKDYPERLKHIPEPPFALFCKGDEKLLDTRCFSVVGSRRTAANMLAECKKISGELTQNFTVVTGLADGADSAAVEGALPSGKVISVLAYGFDYVYPAVNKQLLERVINSGLAVSEYPPQTRPKSYYFPVRNRIIAGLSEGTLVVSAAEKSGALITADYAADYGKSVFAFPYGLGVSSGEGCNNLIKNGAYLTRNADDIFSVFGMEAVEKKQPTLSGNEQKLYELIKDGGEAFVPDIAQKLGVPSYKLIADLSSLEIKGLIVRLGGNRYSAV